MRSRYLQPLYLIRHCQATGQAPDAPLTAVGKQQAIALVDWFAEKPIQRIISSPFVRATQSITPLAQQRNLEIETDNRLAERALSSVPLENWRERLAETFVNLDLSFPGGESSRAAMARGVAVVEEAMAAAIAPVVIVTHGNLMTLILKHFDAQIGFTEWENLQNPDVYEISANGTEVQMKRVFTEGNF